MSEAKMILAKALVEAREQEGALIPYGAGSVKVERLYPTPGRSFRFGWKHLYYYVDSKGCPCGGFTSKAEALCRWYGIAPIAKERG